MIVLVASSSDLLGDTYGLPGVGTLNDPDKALARYKEALEADRAGLRADPACIACLRGVAVEDWKLGGLAIEDPPVAVGFYRDGLSSLARLPLAEQSTPRIQRMDALIRQSLGFMLLDVVKADEGLAMVLGAQHRLQATVAADPLDARAHADLALLDLSLYESYGYLGRTREQMETNQEFLASVEFILHKDPASPTWQFRRSVGLTRAGFLSMKSGNSVDGRRLGREALAIVVPLALKPDAAPRILHFAAITVTNFGADMERDGAMAVSFAQRAIGDEKNPTADEILTLADAQKFAGQTAEARASAQAALKTTDAHGSGIEAAALRVRAERLLE
jgi:tetratricopeptide (TPR) repeat protein